MSFIGRKFEYMQLMDHVDCCMHYSWSSEMFSAVSETDNDMSSVQMQFSW